MISYLKVIHNPEDSIALLRVINTPVRGIGKSSIETLERVALETGLSLWGAIAEVIKRQLLPPRAVAALKTFVNIIEDGRAILSGTNAERLEETAGAEDKPGWPRASRPRSADGEELDDPSVEDDTDFSPDNFSFDFGGDLGADGEIPLVSEPARALPDDEVGAGRLHDSGQDAGATNASASTAEILKFLIDRTGYIKLLEEEDTPEAYSRVENLRELVNAAMDSRDRGETLDQFLDHAALVSDADAYDERAQITLMTLHAAKGLEFPLVFLGGLEEGLFPHSRTFLQPDDIEEERRLCYVGMTRAMDTLILTRAVYRRRYGTDLPEASIPSRFLEEIPVELVEDLGTSRRARSGRVAAGDSPAFGSSRASRPRPHDQTHTSRNPLTTLMKMKTRVRPGRINRRHARRRRLIPASPTTPSRTSPTFSPREARNSACPNCRSRRPEAGRDSVRGRRSAIPNMAKARCTSAKEKVKMPRLRYNSLASV